MQRRKNTLEGKNKIAEIKIQQKIQNIKLKKSPKQGSKRDGKYEEDMILRKPDQYSQHTKYKK